MIKIVKALVSTTAIIGLTMGNITLDNSTSSLSFNFNTAHADGDVCDVVECIEVKWTKWPANMRPSRPEINWGTWGTDAWVGELSASRDRAGTGEAAHYMKYAACVTMAEKAAISCKTTVAAATAVGAVVCVGAGVFFTVPAGAICAAAVAGASAADTLSCDNSKVNDKFFCKGML